MASGIRKPGDFCWINMLTPQPTDARAFFGALLGWTYAEIPGVGHLIQVGGRDVGGLFDLAAPNTPPGTPPMIGVMMKVESADVTAAKATSLGGRTKPAFDIGDQLRMAVCFDPAGVEFDIWESKRGHGTEINSREPGAPTWFELMTTDTDGARTFYQDLFGWTSEQGPMPGGVYTRFRLSGEPVGGMMALTPEMGALPPQWRTYFTVGDAHATAQRAVELGGTLCMRVIAVPGVGEFCGITSPQGVSFCVIAYAQ
jgi:predicted enzyme related to lactoylglutathione lyase